MSRLVETAPQAEIAPVNKLRHLMIIPNDPTVWRPKHVKETTDTVGDILTAAQQNGIEVVTFAMPQAPAPHTEVGIARLLENLTQDAPIRFNFAGPAQCRDGFRAFLEQAQERAQHNGGLRLVFSMSTGRQELVRAARQLIADGVKPEELTEVMIDAAVNVLDLPEPDLILHTGEVGVRGNMWVSLSDRMLWESKYAEHAVTYFPFKNLPPHELQTKIEEFSRRNRTYGAIPAKG